MTTNSIMKNKFFKQRNPAWEKEMKKNTPLFNALLNCQNMVNNIGWKVCDSLDLFDRFVHFFMSYSCVVKMCVGRNLESLILDSLIISFSLLFKNTNWGFPQDLIFAPLILHLWIWGFLNPSSREESFVLYVYFSLIIVVSQ